MTVNKYSTAITKAFQNIKTAFPVLTGILLLVNLIGFSLEKHYSDLFSGNLFLDPLIGAVAGSISFGIPITSYLVSGELLKQGVSLLAVTAFMMCWSTVGLVMIPLEAKFLGKRFAIVRNSINFIFGILISIVTVITLNLFGLI
jgi:hypothetical protein